MNRNLKNLLLILPALLVMSWTLPKKDGTGNPYVYRDFKLSFSVAGLGSNMGSKQPVFKVQGSTFIYTLEQNSFYAGQQRQKPDTIMVGRLRPSSIDSIMSLVRTMKNNEVYRNGAFLSGSVQYLHVQTPQKEVKFTLHNAWDPTAQKIVDILNTYIRNEKYKLHLFNLPHTRNDSQFWGSVDPS